MENCLAQILRLLIPVYLFVIPSSSYSATYDTPCLNAVFRGSGQTKIIACPDNDPLKIAKDPRVISVMKLLDIDLKSVRFRGCEKADFLTIDSGNMSEGTRFDITYPLEVGERYLAPIVHELAHVVQITQATSISKLRAKQSSIEIELSADFIVGYVFARNLQGTDLDEFQHNLSLVGRFVEDANGAHGRPTQRVAAFRRGAFNNYPYPKLGYLGAIDYFLKNDFAMITKN